MWFRSARVTSVRRASHPPTLTERTGIAHQWNSEGPGPNPSITFHPTFITTFRMVATARGAASMVMFLRPPGRSYPHRFHSIKLAVPTSQQQFPVFIASTGQASTSQVSGWVPGPLTELVPSPTRCEIKVGCEARSRCAPCPTSSLILSLNPP